MYLESETKLSVLSKSFRTEKKFWTFANTMTQFEALKQFRVYNYFKLWITSPRLENWEAGKNDKARRRDKLGNEMTRRL